jgi:hypothetical protein
MSLNVDRWQTFFGSGFYFLTPLSPFTLAQREKNWVQYHAVKTGYYEYLSAMNQPFSTSSILNKIPL